MNMSLAIAFLVTVTQMSSALFYIAFNEFLLMNFNEFLLNLRNAMSISHYLPRTAWYLGGNV